MGQESDIEPDDIKSIPTFRAAYADRTALLMARLARRAYEAFDTDDNAFNTFREGFTRLGVAECERLVDPASGTAGFVVAGPDFIVVVFRGTQDLLDWRTNANVAWTVLQGGIRVHSGFVKAYYTIRDPLFATVLRLLKSKSRPVYITGHSLGGALAVMATAELANHDEAEVRDSIAACYTFGCPKAGDRSFDQYVKVPLYRITNGVDLVPAVPPIFSGYKHVGDTRYFGKIGIPPLRRPPNLFRKLWGTFLGLLQFYRTRKLIGIADHSMDVYVAKLERWAKADRDEAQQRRKATADPTM
jgi:triacylglycerol lipase